MRCILIERFTTFLSRLRLMNNHEPAPNSQSPPPECIGIASFACLMALVFFYWYAGPAVRALDVWWAKWLVYACIPILVSFIILYRSGWHREMIGLARTWRLFLLSCAILVGVYFAIGAMLVVAAYGLSSMQSHVGGR